jgi:hypothetical protein
MATKSEPISVYPMSLRDALAALFKVKQSPKRPQWSKTSAKRMREPVLRHELTVTGKKV